MTATQPNTPDVTSALGGVLAELEQKLEPADLAALATAAKQDAAKLVLDAISATETSTLGEVDQVEELLTAIRDRLLATLSVGGPLTDTELRATPVEMQGVATSEAIDGGAVREVTEDSGVLTGPDPDRLVLIVTSDQDNPSTAWLRLGSDSDALVGAGIPIYPGSGYVFSGDERWTGEVRAITESGTFNLSVVEF